MSRRVHELLPKSGRLNHAYEAFVQVRAVCPVSARVSEHFYRAVHLTFNIQERQRVIPPRIGEPCPAP